MKSQSNEEILVSAMGRSGERDPAFLDAVTQGSDESAGQTEHTPTRVDDQAASIQT